MVRWTRYKLSQEKQDLDKCIVHCTEAIFLPPISWDGSYLNNVFQLLFHIASALLELSEEFEQPDGVKYSIEYLRYLRGLPLDPSDLHRNLVTTSLIRALAIQVSLDAGDMNMTRNIKEMVDLCRELLASNASVDFLNSAFSYLNQAANTEFIRGQPIQLLNEVIECLQDAVKLFPSDSHDVLYALSNQLFGRFIITHSNDDYEEATAQLERILDPNRTVGCPDSIRVLASSLFAVFALFRSAVFENPEYSEVAISRLRTLLSSPSVSENFRLHITDVLGIQA